MIEAVLFYTFATILVGSALAVITVRNPVHAALFLVLTFVTSSALWVLLEAEFLAIALVLVYVGAVMVLFLFVVMMLDVEVAPLREGFARYLPVGLVVAGVMLAELVIVLLSGAFDLGNFGKPIPHPQGYSNTEEVGVALFTEHLFAFEVAAAVLLVAIVAAIMLTLRRRPETRYQQPERQVSVTKSDRLRIVQLESDR